MPDGAGYLVLDKFGGVDKFGSALLGAVGTASTPCGESTSVATSPSCRCSASARVLRARRLGRRGRHQRPGAEDTNPASSLFRDRWRGIAIYGGKPLLLRNDGTTQLTN